MLFLQNYFNRDSKFQLSRYILPVLSFYLLPVLLFNLNLLPLPTPKKPNLSDISKTLAETKNSIVTQCKPKNVDEILAGVKNCTNGENCNLKNDYLTCPPSPDQANLKYCCEYSDKEKTWTECCDAFTYGIRQHTTSNITIIYFFILSLILSVMCCPCSPVFRNVRQKIFQKMCRRTKK